MAVFRLNWRRASRVGRSSLVIGVVKDGSVMVGDILCFGPFLSSRCKLLAKIALVLLGFSSGNEGK